MESKTGIPPKKPVRVTATVSSHGTIGMQDNEACESIRRKSAGNSKLRMHGIRVNENSEL